MFCNVQNFEIFDSVVMLISVFVVNLFFSPKFSSQKLFHDMSMLKNSYSIDRYSFVFFEGKLNSSPQGIACLTAKSLFSFSRWRNKKFFSTLITQNRFSAKVNSMFTSNFIQSLRLSFRFRDMPQTFSRATFSSLGTICPDSEIFLTKLTS